MISLNILAFPCWHQRWYGGPRIIARVVLPLCTILHTYCMCVFCDTLQFLYAIYGYLKILQPPINRDYLPSFPSSLPTLPRADPSSFYPFSQRFNQGGWEGCVIFRLPLGASIEYVKLCRKGFVNLVPVGRGSQDVRIT